MKFVLIGIGSIMCLTAACLSVTNEPPGNATQVSPGDDGGTGPFVDASSNSRKDASGDADRDAGSSMVSDSGHPVIPIGCDQFMTDAGLGIQDSGVECFNQKDVVYLCDTSMKPLPSNFSECTDGLVTGTQSNYSTSCSDVNGTDQNGNYHDYVACCCPIK